MSRFLRFFVAEMLLCLLLLAIWPRLGMDDSYIFLTYARRLAESGLFAFNPGQVTYGFSSPAYVMALAGLSRLTSIPVGVALSNLFGILMCAVSVAAVWSLWGELRDQPSDRELPLAALLFSGPWFFTVWFVFGMETSLAVASVLGFLLSLAKLRNGASRLSWLVIGVIATSLLATTRLESSIYIACGVLIALVTVKSKREILDLLIVGTIAGCVEVSWLLYAHRTFGTYLPWTSTARLIYYLPVDFPHIRAYDFFRLGLWGRSLIAAKAIGHMLFGGPLKFLLVALPLLIAIIMLRVRRNRISGNWTLWIVTLGMAIQILTFAFLFPLAQNRHLAPYIVAIWALVVPQIARFLTERKLSIRIAAFAVLVLLWIGGAVQYRNSGIKFGPLHQLAASAQLQPTDKIAAEPIGILSFESKAQIIDLGGLTDRDVWPLLMNQGRITVQEVITWDIKKGATKLLLEASDCGSKGTRFGGYCLIDANEARSLQHEQP